MLSPTVAFLNRLIGGTGEPGVGQVVTSLHFKYTDAPSNTHQPETPPCLLQNTCQELLLQKGPQSLSQNIFSQLNQNFEYRFKAVL